MVGTWEMRTRRSALATLGSVSLSTNFTYSDVSSRIWTRGKRGPAPMAAALAQGERSEAGRGWGSRDGGLLLTLQLLTLMIERTAALDSGAASGAES